jgi:general secretion pathway protein M
MNGPWSKLSVRDRRIVAIGGVVVALLLGWSLAWLPLADSRASLRTTAAANATALAWMRPASARLAAIGGARVARAGGGGSLLARVDAGARVAGLGGSLVGIEPQDAQHVRVQLSGADFDVLASWLEGAAADGIRVEELSLQRASGPGRVDARVSLREDAP